MSYDMQRILITQNAEMLVFLLEINHITDGNKTKRDVYNSFVCINCSERIYGKCNR